MSLIVIDFETFYSKDYSLSKMRTEQYVLDPRFEVIMVGVKINDQPPYFVTGTHKQIGQHLASLNLEQHAVLAHNMMFDGLILAVHFGIYPKVYLDTRLMAQPVLKPYIRSVSLDSCLKHLELGIQKGTEVHNMLGRTRGSLSKEEMDRYGQYCMDDCEGEYRLFKYLKPMIPSDEMEIIDITLRMYLQPQFVLDARLLAEVLGEVRAKKAQLLASLPPEVQKPELMSNEKFAQALIALGVDPPTKLSPITGKQSYAFAKTDTAWKDMEEEYANDPEVSALITARIGIKSTIEETRCVTMLDIANTVGKFRVPLLYYAAHPGRYGGMERINAQNLPRVDKSRLRYAVKAPKGHVVLAADLAQIEARITAWLAKQGDLLEAFRNREDIYSIFASAAFHTEVVKGRSAVDNRRRFIGKTCILGLGYGMGNVKLMSTLRKDGVKLGVSECQHLTNTYRSKYGNIASLWSGLGILIGSMVAGAIRSNVVGVLSTVGNTIVLPNKMALVYPNLQIAADGSGYTYEFAGEKRTMWGGKVLENISQALARILIMHYMLEIKRKLKLLPALQQHDELDYVIPVQYADRAAEAIGKIIRTSLPAWAEGLPIEVEINYGASLGDCK